MVENLAVPLRSLEYSRAGLWRCDIGTLALSRPHFARDTCKQMEITQHGKWMLLGCGRNDKWIQHFCIFPAC